MILADQVAGFDAVPAPRVMVIQDLDDPPAAAVYGEVMASTYQAFGCVGLVTNGFARDILQVRELKFPCFASGVCVSHLCHPFQTKSFSITGPFNFYRRCGGC